MKYLQVFPLYEWCPKNENRIFDYVHNNILHANYVYGVFAYFTERLSDKGYEGNE